MPAPPVYRPNALAINKATPAQTGGRGAVQAKSLPLAAPPVYRPSVRHALAVQRMAHPTISPVPQPPRAYQGAGNTFAQRSDAHQAPPVYRPFAHTVLRKAPSPKPANRGVVQRDVTEAEKIDILNSVAKMYLTGKDFMAASLVNKEMSNNLGALRDARMKTPDSAAILHRLNGQTARAFVEARNLNDPMKFRVEDFEATDSKYAPQKYGSEHTWLGNLDWLEDAKTKFDTMFLTALPLTRHNLLRQTEFKRGFSAYAREIAWLLKKGYSYSNGKLVRTSTGPRLDDAALSKILGGQAGNEEDLYKAAAVLRSAGIPLDQDLSEGASRSAHSQNDEMEDLQQVLKIDFPRRGRVDQWPADDFRKAVENWKRSKPGGENLRVSKNEAKNYKAKLPKGFET